MKKKTLCLLLTAAMLTGSLTACGKDDAPAVTPAPTAEATPADDTTTDDTSADDASADNASTDDNSTDGNSTDDASDTGDTNGEGNGAPEFDIVHVRDLSNPNATEEAQLLYDYLCSVSGHGILAGTEEGCGAAAANNEINYLKKVTGKYPALRGLDFINDDFEGVVKRATFWANSMHGIVTIGWHWGAPPDGIGYDSSKGSINLTEALTEGTDLYNAMIEQMDIAADYLKQLQDEGVVVLWRPFHEFDGQWFWWGKGGSEKFIQLWQLMYDRYTNYHGLNNLIWVLGYSTQIKDGWYPGDEYVDIVGADNYGKGTRHAMYNRAASFGAEGMPVPLHECDFIPNPDELIEDNAKWTWFMTWTLDYLKENTKEELESIYNHDYVITLDELPDWDTLQVTTE